MKSSSNGMPKSMFAKGLELCEKNGERLLKDSIQAFQRRAFVCAFILGFTAWEEFGKASLILEYWNEDLVKYATWKKEFRSHRFKIHQARYISDKTLLRGVSKELGLTQKDLQEIIVDEEYLKKVHEMRKRCLHVDFDFKGKVWKSPIEIDDKLHNWAVDVIMGAEFSKRALQSEKKRKLNQ